MSVSGCMYHHQSLNLAHVIKNKNKHLLTSLFPNLYYNGYVCSIYATLHVTSHSCAVKRQRGFDRRLWLTVAIVVIFLIN